MRPSGESSPNQVTKVCETLTKILDIDDALRSHAAALWMLYVIHLEREDPDKCGARSWMINLVAPHQAEPDPDVVTACDALLDLHIDEQRAVTRIATLYDHPSLAGFNAVQRRQRLVDALTDYCTGRRLS